MGSSTPADHSRSDACAVACAPHAPCPGTRCTTRDPYWRLGLLETGRLGRYSSSALLGVMPALDRINGSLTVCHFVILTIC